MLYGWLLRCDPGEGHFELEIGSGAVEAQIDGATVVSAGARLEPGADVAEPPSTATATAVWNADSRTLRLVRDRTGLHPLFHAWVGATLVASTDLRALLREPGVSRTPNAAAVAEWLLERSGPPDETLLQAVRRVPAGHVLTVEQAGETSARRWAPPTPGTHDAAAADGLGDVLEAAVRKTLDTPAAVFLSGGIDSAAVAVAAVTISREQGYASPLALCADIASPTEVRMQRLVSDRLGLGRVERQFTPEPASPVRALELARTAVWPAQAAWWQVGVDLVDDALTRGHSVLLDGLGGDAVLDPGLEPPARLLRRRRLRALGDVTGPRESLPRWIADPELRVELEERAASAAADDLLDPFMAAGIEASFLAGAEGGYRLAHPFLDADVVALVRGLADEEPDRGGEPTSPLRTYLRVPLPPDLSFHWARPPVATDIPEELLRLQRRDLEATLRGTPILEGLGITQPNVTDSDISVTVEWLVLAMEQWLEAVLSGEDHVAPTRDDRVVLVEEDDVVLVEEPSVESPSPIVEDRRAWQQPAVRHAGDVRIASARRPSRARDHGSTPPTIDGTPITRAFTGPGLDVPALAIGQLDVPSVRTTDGPVVRWETHTGQELFGYQADGWEWISVPGVATFRFGTSGEVVAVPEGTRDDAVDDTWLRSVLPLVVQARGTEVLRASAVVTDGLVVALFGASGSGKSTLAASLARHGLEIAADDALPVTVGPGGVCTTSLRPPPKLDATHDAGMEPRPLAALILLDPHEHELPGLPAFDQLSPADAFTALVPYAYAHAFEEGKRALVTTYLELARRVPTFRLSYVQRLDRVDETVAAILGLTGS